jgi:hypothetical protein
MRAADDRSRRKLWSCYDNGARSRLHEPLPLAVGDVVGKHAAALVAQDELDVRREGVLRAWDLHHDGVPVDCVAYSRIRGDG